MCGIDHEVERQAKRFVKVKRLLACEVVLQFFIEPRKPDLQHTVELLFFRFNDLGDASGGINQFGIRPLHQIANGEDHLIEKRLLLPQQTPMTNPAAKDLTQYISATFVRRQHAIVD